MTDRKEALQELLAKVEAGDYDKRFNGFCDQWEKVMPIGSYGDAWRAYNGSLDAAKALHAAVLPGHRARIDIGRKFRAWVITPENAKFDAYADTPARAWLIAIIKALIAEAGR